MLEVRLHRCALAPTGSPAGVFIASSGMLRYNDVIKDVM